MSPQALENIGHYEVTGKLGEGGMGVVYRGRDAAIGRQVAIKMMIGDYINNAELRERFTREARAAGNLQHPNIVTIHELGEQAGAPYIVMEFLEGEPLDHVIAANRPMALPDKLEMIIQVCDALDYAHQRGIVHRDIKPANVMVLKQGGIKLVDFGIARLGGQKLTRTGTVMGTINYMSPEQINGKPVDGRADVFSTGVMLYELLSGRLPFEGEDTTQTMFKILTAPAPPVGEALPGAPPELQAVLDHALAKERDQRYASAADMARELVAVRDQMGAAPLKTAFQRNARASQSTTPPEMTMVQGSAAPATIAATLVQGSAAAVAPAAVTQATVPAAAAAAVEQKKKGGAGILIAVVLVIVLGIGGFFGYKKFVSGPAENPQQQVTTPDTSAPTASSVPNSTAPANSAAQPGADELVQKGDAFLHAGDSKQAAAAYEQAVGKNHSGAMTKLARMYLFNQGVEQDSGRAAELFKRAAELREPNAVLGLARVYRDGSGVAKDPVEAYKWYTIALSFDPVKSTAQSERELMELSNDQIADATQRATAWLAAHK